MAEQTFEPGQNPGTPAINRDQFLQTLVLTTNLSGTAYRLAVVLVTMAVRGTAWPSLSTLARMLGVSRQWIIHAQAELEKTGAFEIERRAGPGGANVITPCWWFTEREQPVWDRYHATKPPRENPVGNGAGGQRSFTRVVNDPSPGVVNDRLPGVVNDPSPESVLSESEKSEPAVVSLVPPSHSLRRTPPASRGEEGWIDGAKEPTPEPPEPDRSAGLLSKMEPVPAPQPDRGACSRDWNAEKLLETRRGLARKRLARRLEARGFDYGEGLVRMAVIGPDEANRLADLEHVGALSDEALLESLGLTESMQDGPRPELENGHAR